MVMFVRENVIQKESKGRMGDITRRCMECDSSFHLSRVNENLAECSNCGHDNTPIGSDSYFVSEWILVFRK